jgi:S-DNA-T family DNA segregation ATPase FtsK/SpoIIIE
MASKNTSSGSRQQTTRSNRDSARWTLGLLLFFTGLFATASVLFSFFCWSADLSVLQGVGSDSPLYDDTVENLCGRAGAWLGEQLVGRSFGVFGVLIPVMLTLVGVRIIRQRPILFNHSILSLSLIMILGSLTLGFAFGDKWSLCSSTGWGGAFGIGGGEWLGAQIGSVGTLILLLGGWILTGVFINRNFINTVNTAGNAMVDKGGRIVDMVCHKMASGHAQQGEQEEQEAEAAPSEPSSPRTAAQAAQAAPAAQHAAQRRDAAAERPATTSERENPRDVPGRTGREVPHDEPATLTVQRRAEEPRPTAAAASEENPFLELAPDGKPVEMEIARHTAEEAAEQPHAPHADASDDAFEEVDLASREGRLVMGRSGLVELERPAAPVRRPAVVQNGPFTEITVGGEPAPESAPEASGEAGAARQDSSARHAAPEPAADPSSPFVEIALTPAASQHEAETAAPHYGEEAPAAPQYEAETPAAPAAPLHAAAEPVESLHAAAAEPGIVVTVEANKAREVDDAQIATDAYDPLKDLVNYHRPPVSLLEDYMSDTEVSDEEIYENKSKIEETLKNFGIPIQRIKATVGPTVTLYEIVQAQGVKISKIQGLENDIAQSLKALGIRIIAPIPGKGTIGIEVPNRDKQVVSMYSAIRSLRFQESKAELPVVIGRTIQNENYVFDLTKMPHLLVAGATGQGKSVGLNAIITSLLYRKHPAQLKFVMIDPKMVEFSLYAKIEKHFLAKMESEEEAIITDPRKAVYTLNSLCMEMDARLELCKKAGARNISEYNEKFVSRRLNPHNGHRYLPYIVVVVDEFADLIMTAREVEGPVMRLAQKARAIGIHLIIATQRPDVKVITGGIKANFPARIAFRVMQMIDSRTIIDQPGANQLIGRGDMLFSKDGQLTRIQCALVETREVERIVDYISKQQGYTSAYLLPDYAPDSGEGGGGMGSEESSAPQKYDSLFAEIARDAVSSGSISTSMIQRNYEVGFNRAGRIMMQLERAGIVGRQQGAKPRDILFHDMPSLEAKLQELGLF